MSRLVVFVSSGVVIRCHILRSMLFFRLVGDPFLSIFFAPQHSSFFLCTTSMLVLVVHAYWWAVYAARA